MSSPGNNGDAVPSDVRRNPSSYRSVLRSSLHGERKAYGFTLVIWGGATMTASVRGTPTAVDGIAYIGGALAAMAAVILITLGVDDEPRDSERNSRLSLGAIHLVSVAGALAGAWLVAEVLRTRWLAYLATGAVATLIYQLLLALEATLGARNTGMRST